MPKQQNKEYTVCLLGPSKIGKTTLIYRQIYNTTRSAEKYEATLQDFYSQHCVIDGVVGHFLLLDTSGLRHYPGIRRLEILTADAFILIFYSGDSKSCVFVKDIFKVIKSVRGDEAMLKIPIILLDNKHNRKESKAQNKVQVNNSADMSSFSTKIGAVLLEINLATEPEEISRIFQAICFREQRVNIDLTQDVNEVEAEEDSLIPKKCTIM